MGDKEEMPRKEGDCLPVIVVLGVCVVAAASRWLHVCNNALHGGDDSLFVAVAAAAVHRLSQESPLSDCASLITMDPGTAIVVVGGEVAIVGCKFTTRNRSAAQSCCCCCCVVLFMLRARARLFLQ